VSTDLSDAQNPDGRKTIRLYSPGSFPVLAMLFSQLLPGILYAINIGKLGNARKRNLLIVIFLGLEAALFALVIVSSAKFGNYAKYVFEAINIGVGSILYQKQKADYQAWKTDGTKPCSLLWPICIAIVPVTLIVVLSVLNPLTGAKSYLSDGSTIYYDNGVSKTDVEAVSGVLEKIGLFTPGGATFNLMLRNESSGLVLLFPTRKEFLKTAEASEFLSSIEKSLVESGVFKNGIKVVQADEYFSVVK
jgi:hypothetical protein